RDAAATAATPSADMSARLHRAPAATQESRAPEPIGVCFSGGVDSGAVFLLTYHVMRKLGMSPSRLKAFTLSFGDGPDLQQAREFLNRVDLFPFLETIDAD